ncbi:hypothetical protein [Azotobacter vinelandii]
MKRVLSDYLDLSFTASISIGGEWVMKEVEVDYGAHVPTLLKVLPSFHDYRSDTDDDYDLNLTWSANEIAARERRASGVRRRIWKT